MNPAVSGRRRYLIVIKNLRFLYSHFWSLAEAVQAAGWEVWIASEADGSSDRVLQAGMKFFELPPIAGPWDLAGTMRSLKSLHAAVSQIGPELLHLIYLRSVLTGAIVARLTRTPALLGAVTGLGSLFASDRLLYKAVRRGVLSWLRFGFQHPNSVIAFENSDDRKDFVASRVIDPGRTVIIPGAGVERDAILPAAEPGGAPVVLCVSRMIRDKGILDLAAAARLLRRRGVSFCLWLVGDTDAGNPTAITREELASLEVEGIAQWLGNRSDVPELMHEATIFCLPTCYREGLPRVLVEAGAAGLPIVTTEVPGCRELVDSGVNGILVPPRNVAAIADALQFLLEHADIRKKMRIASRTRFEERFTADAVRSAFNRCYDLLSVPIQLHMRDASSACRSAETQSLD